MYICATAFIGSDITENPFLWIEDDGTRVDIIADKRVGIGYASIEDQNRLWRFKKG